MAHVRDFLRTIQSQAAAGDPAVVSTVRVFADWLEERGDPRAAWVAGLANCIRHNRNDAGFFSEYWTVDKPLADRLQSVEGLIISADAYRELARRVLAAMTRTCPNFRIPSITSNVCPTCHGDGFMITEAEVCGKCNASGRVRSAYQIGDTLVVPRGFIAYLPGQVSPLLGIRVVEDDIPETTCPDCDGKTWRIKEWLADSPQAGTK